MLENKKNINRKCAILWIIFTFRFDKAIFLEARVKGHSNRCHASRNVRVKRMVARLLNNTNIEYSGYSACIIC